MAKDSFLDTIFKNIYGFTPDSKTRARLSMLPETEVEDVVKGTQSEVKSEAINTAQSAIAALSGNMPEGPAQEYLETVARGKTAIEEKYGLTAAREKMAGAEEFYRGVAIAGPTFETAMRGELEEISPTFLGATRKDMEEYYSGIPNPFVRNRMVKDYLDASDKGMTSTLNALNGIYQTALMGAQTAMEMDQKHYDRIADTTKTLYSELQWIARNRYIEQTEKPTEYAPSELEREWTAMGGTEGTGMTFAEYVGSRRDVPLPRNWMDPELKKAIGAMRADDLTYEEVLDEIAIDRTILNKERAYEMAAELYGIEPIIPEIPAEPAEMRFRGIPAGLGAAPKEKPAEMRTAEEAARKAGMVGRIGPEGEFAPLPEYTTPLYE